jgi:hypothetical protein
MLSKITLALAGKEAVKNHCAYCHGKFGMVRHRRAFKVFCSQKCVAHHKAWLRAEARKRKGWLETGLAGRGGKTRTQESVTIPALRLRPLFFVSRFARCTVLPGCCHSGNTSGLSTSSRKGISAPVSCGAS